MALVALLVGFLSAATLAIAPQVATAATIVGVDIEVLADGTGHGTLNECPIVDPDTTLVDESPIDRVVCTDDSVLFGWNYSIAADGADDVVISQTLPAGWVWDAVSSTACTGGDDYTGVPVISPDGRTLTCTLTFPNTGNARSGQIPVLAIPKPGVPNESTYAAELVVTDDGSTITSEPADTITVRSEPRWNLIKTAAFVDYFVDDVDFDGAGPGVAEPALEIGYWLYISSTSANNFKGQDALAPFSIEDIVSGVSPNAALARCERAQNIAVNCSQPAGAGTPITVDVPGGIPELPTVGEIYIGAGPILAGVAVTVAIPASELPPYPTATTTINQAIDFDPDGLGGASNLGDDVENGTEPGAECVQGNGNDNCAYLAVTEPVPGPGNIYTGKSLRQIDNSATLNCGGHWWWCEPLEGTTGTSANNNSSQGNQDGVAYRGDTFGAGLSMGWDTQNAELPENPVMCDVWDPALQEFYPDGFPLNAPLDVVWDTVYEPTMHYTNQVFADDAAREAADCGEYSDVNNGVWYDDWDDVPGGVSAISGVRFTVPISRDYPGAQWTIPMKVAEGAPVGTVVPDFLHLYFDQQVDPEDNPDGWTFRNRDSYRVNDLQIVLDKDTVPAGQTGTVVGSRVPFSLTVSAIMQGVQTAPRELTGAVVVDTLDPCLLAPELAPASAANWSMAITPAATGVDGIACTADDVSGAVLTFTPLAPVMSGTTVPPILYSVVVSTRVPNGGQVDNTAVVKVDDGVTLQTEAARSDEWQLLVAAPGAVRISKVADFPLVEIEPDDLSWTITFSNSLTTNLGEAEFIDVLPWNGDGRGTSFDGNFGFNGVEILEGSDVTISYTTEAPGGINTDPAANTSTWVTAASYAGDLADVTAFKIEVAAFASGEVGSVRVHADPSGNSEGDTYDNRVAAGRVVGLSQAVPPTLISEIRVVASSIGDRVWFDKNLDGVQDAGEFGFEGVTVRLLDADGNEIDSTETGTDGIYAFSGYHSETYRVVVDESTLPLGFSIPTYDLDGGIIAPDSDSGDVALGIDIDRVDVDFGYARQDPGDLTIAKVIPDEGAAWFGEDQTFTIEVTCETFGETDEGFPQDVVITGSGSETIEAPFGSICTAEETDDGGATIVSIDPEDGVLIDSYEDDLSITVENTFEAGELIVRKLLEGPGVESFGDGPFVFEVDCTYQDQTVFEDEITLEREGDEESLESEPITDLPIGTSCTITEADNGGADDTPPAVTVLINDSEEAVFADLTNWFTRGNVSVEKIVDGELSDWPLATDYEFEVTVTCQIESGDPVVRSTILSGPVTIRAGEVITSPVDLPVGARCFMTETDAGSATDVTIANTTFETGLVVVASDSETAQVLELVATNTFDAAHITIDKTVTGNGPAGPYTFEVTCTLDGEEVEIPEEFATLELSHGESITIPVPIGADCTVIEVDVPILALVAVTDSDDESDEGTIEDVTGDENTVSFTNVFPIVEGDLPNTGMTVNPTLFAGGVVVAAGLALLMWGLRRRRIAESHN